MSTATVSRSDDTMTFRGALTRAAVAPVWAQAQPLLAGARRFDLQAVSEVDSAGLALLAELGAGIDGLQVAGSPPGLAELRDAYRLEANLAF